jgi:hypothetical protein
MKVGSTVGWFTMARWWATVQRGTAAQAGRRQRLAGLGRKKGVTSPQVDRLGRMGRAGQLAGWAKSQGRILANLNRISRNWPRLWKFAQGDL